MFRSWQKYYYHVLFCRRVSKYNRGDIFMIKLRSHRQLEKKIGYLNSSQLFHHSNLDLSIFLKKNKTKP